jgi:hypothetical protein
VISIEKAKGILSNEQSKLEYTDIEIQEIIDFSEVYAKIVVDNLKKKSSS